MPADQQSRPPARAQLVLQRLTQPFISRPPSAHAIREEQRRPDEEKKERDRSQSRSRLQSRSKSYAETSPLSSVDISPSRTSAIIAGRDTFKILAVKSYGIVEEHNLRATMAQHAAMHSRTPMGRSKDVLAIVDVKWSHGAFANVIATAPTNGKIVLYDIKQTPLEIIRLHEHQRSVHKLAFNPHDGRYLLSGSQDGTVKFWDLREYAGGRSLEGASRSTKTIQGRSDAVRDVKWSPRDGYEFAFVTDNGSLQRWDIRKDSQFLMKVAAHDGPCFTLDYHLDGLHIASAGRDKCVKVWQLDAKMRRHKPGWELRTPQAVYHLAWRPAQGPGMPSTTQIATSYHTSDSRVQVWDFSRKYVPYREFEVRSGSTTAMLWAAEDLLWTVGKDGQFLQTDINFAAQPQTRRPYQAADISARGDVGFFIASGPSKQSTRDARQLHEERHLQRSSSMSRAKANGEPNVLSFKESLELHPPFVSPQLGGWQSARAGCEAEAYAYLADNYALTGQGEASLEKRLYNALDWNARLAQMVGKYRTATIWMILRDALEQQLAPQVIAWVKNQQKQQTAPESLLLRKALLHEMVNSSNMTTPLARPVPDTPRIVEPKQRPDTELDQIPQLPPSWNEGSVMFPDGYGERISPEYTKTEIKPDLRLNTHLSSESPDEHLIFSASTDQHSYDSKQESSLASTDVTRAADIANGSENYQSTDSSILLPVTIESPAVVPADLTQSGTLNPPTPLILEAAMPDSAFQLPLVGSNEPWQLQTLLTQALDHAVRTGDLQLAATMSLLLASVVEISTDVAEIADLLPAYWSQLSRKQLHVAAAQVAQLSHDLLYPNNVGADVNSYMTLVCGRCGKPLENISSRRSAWWCDHCAYLQDACTICCERLGGRWSWCVVCSHGGHDQCLRGWFDAASGHCPGEGCSCICVEKRSPMEVAMRKLSRDDRDRRVRVAQSGFRVGEGTAKRMSFSSLRS